MIIIFIHRPFTDIHTLSLHDALPIFEVQVDDVVVVVLGYFGELAGAPASRVVDEDVEPAQTRGRLVDQSPRSEEHTSELQSRENIVCRLLLEKKKNIQ